jgi:flagellar FliJ protein
MAKFRFRFQAVENVRKRAEDEAMRLMGEAQRALQAAKDHKARLEQELADSLERRESIASSGFNVTALQLEDSFITGTKQRIIQADQGIIRAARGLEKAIRAYMFARRQTRMIETIREKDLAEFKKELQKREQKELDDIYVMRAARTQSDEEKVG